MNRMNCWTAAHQARRCAIGRVALPLFILLALLLAGGCTGLAAPATGAAPTWPGLVPSVQVDLSSPGVIQPGDLVEIRVTTADGRPAAAYRLSIDGADTGWQSVDSLAEPALAYAWIAGEPGTYAIVGQARDAAGQVGEQRRQVVVMPPAAPEVTGQARVYATKVALPTYPMEDYQTRAVDPAYRWPYQVFDRERFQVEAPTPEVRSYRLLVLENDYLQVTVLPELGGRIWQVLHKPSGETLFYQNTVVKPTPWGPSNQLGWLGLGGLEWGLPVIEHGYDWGTSWVVTTFERDDGAVGVTIATPDDGRLLAAEITVTLRPNVAYLEIAPSLRNLANRTLAFDYWHTAMLAPGLGNRPSADLRFVLPGSRMTVHSTGDTALPGPGQQFTWPQSFGRDLSRLGNWDRYLGFFETPAAHGPFVGVYDPAADAGVVRAFPADIVRGSKVFGLGWRRPIGSWDYTDDDSAYVELHAGLAPTFFEQAKLPAGGQVAWEEVWYPVRGMGGMVAAGRAAALNVEPLAEGVALALYAPAPLTGTLVVETQDSPVPLAATASGAPENRGATRIPVQIGPEAPVHVRLERVSLAQMLAVRLEDSTGKTLLTYTPRRP